MNDRNSNPDLILRGGKVTTLDRANPLVAAVAISKGKFVAVGSDKDVMNLAGPDTQTIELKGRRVRPGLIDNHMHIIRGGLNFNMELRWDGVRSLADAMAMLKRQVAATPPPQWVRVVGGFSETQFVEKRLPTIDELNAVAPDTPVFLLHLYDRAILNAAALRVVGYTKETPDLVTEGRRGDRRRSERIPRLKALSSAGDDTQYADRPQPHPWAYHGNLHAGNEKLLSPADT